MRIGAPVIDTVLPVDQWRSTILDRLAAGDRFAALFGTTNENGCYITALLAGRNSIDAVHTVAPATGDETPSYRCLSDEVPAAFWYERALHDLSGVIPVGHPRLDPLLLPLADGLPAPRPGLLPARQTLRPLETRGPVDVQGRGMFVIPFGPVRSGVFESIEYLIETPGEDIPHLNIRPHYKHRGVAKSFEGLTPDRGVLVAERVEGIASVSHALAFCHAIERISGTTVPATAGRARVVHAELERIINHLDVVMRLTDAAGLAVATARFGWHKERFMRLVSQLCGNRFGRGVVIPGGVSDQRWVMTPGRIADEVAWMVPAVRADSAALMTTASFLDRVRGTGRLDADLARRCGALGPVARGSGFNDDDRWVRGYDAYPELPSPRPATQDAGDAAARLRVRLEEINSSAELIARALEGLDMTGGALTADSQVEDGFALGWAEAPQGEVLYAVQCRAGRIVRCLARSASFHNLLLFHDVFRGDVLTDFPFIEASFGLSPAGVAM